MSIDMDIAILLLFGVPFLGALAGGYLVNVKRRRMRVDATGVGEVFKVEIDVDSADAEKAVESLRGAIDAAIERFEKLHSIAKDMPTVQ